MDILLVKDGTLRIGESVILLEDQTRVVLQGHFYKIRSLSNKNINPFFLYWALMNAQTNILSMSLTQSTLSSNTIDRIKEVVIPFPPETEQNKIAENMENIIRSRNCYRKKFLDICTM